MNRRNFLLQTALAGGTLALPNWAHAANGQEEEQRLVILHTNDVHSRLDPFPMDGGRNQGLGGVAARAAIIESIRRQHQHVLLLDAGDIFQGTPYFNMYKGEPEIKAMTAMHYDACTMGNHDFDGGLENFAQQMMHASFPVVICNYDFSRTAMESQWKPYQLFKKGKLKIGVLGVGIELKGLVPENLYGNTVYLDPITKANETAWHLKHREKCDLIICLSHLGYQYRDAEKISDKVLARESEYIDLIIGGHTHTFLNEPDVLTNKKGSQVLVNQVGWGGLALGQIEYNFLGTKKKNFFDSRTISIEKKNSM